MSKVKIGIDIGGTKMLLVSIDNAEIVGKKRILTGKDFTSAQIVEEIERFLNEQNFSHVEFGIAVPGLVDENGKIVMSDVLPNLNGWQPKKDLEKFGETFVINDGNAALLEAAAQFPDAKNLGVIVVGTGIGAAFMLDGKILKGEKSWAGELGYFPIKIGNQYKTLDEVSSGAGILKRLNLNADELSLLINKQEEIVLSVITEAGKSLGSNLAGLINLLNLSALVLTGGTFRWQGYKEAVLSEIKLLTIPEFYECCRIEVNMEFETLVINGAIRAINDGKRTN